MPPVSTDPHVWFLADRQNPDSTLSVFTSGNLVKPLIDGLNYMKAIHDLIVATHPGDYIFFAGWRLDRDQELIYGVLNSRVDKIFTDAHHRGVELRIMLSLHISPRPLPVTNVNHEFHMHFPGPCILDSRHPFPGSAHQKFASIFHNGTLHAFCGGIDLAADRWDYYPEHGEGGWHDVHCYVQGPACRDLDITFRERWNDRRRPSRLTPAPPQITLPIPTPAAAGPHHVQILRTYPCAFGYPFATQGEFTSRRACLQAIRLAQDYIYIEDQFFVSYEVASALEIALASQPGLKVIVVVPEEPIGPMKSSFNYHQNYIINKLTSFHSDDFAIYHLKNAQPNHAGNQIYVHAKVMIVDDVWVKIGSTNLTRRDMAHDLQVDVAVVDRTIINGVCEFARDFRLKLWAEHLRLPYSDSQLISPKHGFYTWRDRAGTPGVPAEPHTAASPRWDNLWNKVVDPQMLCPSEPRIRP